MKETLEKLKIRFPNIHFKVDHGTGCFYLDIGDRNTLEIWEQGVGIYSWEYGYSKLTFEEFCKILKQFKLKNFK